MTLDDISRLGAIEEDGRRSVIGKNELVLSHSRPVHTDMFCGV